MKYSLLLLLLLTQTIWPQTIQAQVIIKPGDPSIHYEWLTNTHDFYKVTVFDSTGRKKLEIMNEQVQTIDSIKHTILSARSRQVPSGRWMIDTSICTTTLTPIRMHEFDQPKTFEHDFHFAGTKAYIKDLKKGILSIDTCTMTDDYFDENSIEGFLGVIPFEKGREYRLNSFRIGQPGRINPYDIEYVFDDTWDQPGDNDLNCNVLRFKNAYSAGYIWIDRHKHKMVKEYIRMNSGDKVIVVER
jgi:hypothetical protein